MNMPSVSPAEALGGLPPPARPAATRRVVDAPTRAFHWLFALSFLGAFITADGERFRLVHVTLGYTVIGLVVFRLLWGLVGPRPVRLSTWAGKLRGLPAFVASVRQGRASWSAGQHLLQTLAIVSLIGLAVVVTASGHALYEELSGEWLEDVHETLGNAMLAVVGIHLAGVAAGSWLRRQNQAMTMLTGRVPGRGPDLVPRNHAALAALMLAAVLAGWSWQWQASPAGGAGTGNELGATIGSAVGQAVGSGGTGSFGAGRSRGHDEDDD